MHESVMTQNWAFVCGKLDAATGKEPNISVIPAGYQGIYCRGYDAQKEWAEGTTLKMIEAKDGDKTHRKVETCSTDGEGG